MASDVHCLGRFCVSVTFDPIAPEYRATVSNGRYAVTLHAPTEPKLKDRVDRLIRGYFGAPTADIVFDDSGASPAEAAWAAQAR